MEQTEEVSISEEELAELTATVTALPYTERVDLLNSLARSLYCTEGRNAEPQKKDWGKILDKYIGCMGGLWADEDPLEYQWRLREDREIG